MATGSRHIVGSLSKHVKRGVTLCAVVLALTPALSALPAAAAMPIVNSSLGTRAPVMAEPNPGDGHQKCAPHPGEGVNPHCPPPVVPEAPIAILLPLSAGAVLGIAYFVTRRRSGPNAA